MLKERLRDSDEEWGLSRIEAARKEQRRQKEREKKRSARLAHRQHVIAVATENAKRSKFRDLWPLTSVEGQAIGIIAVHGRHRKSDVEVSLPYVRFIHGPIVESNGEAG